MEAAFELKLKTLMLRAQDGDASAWRTLLAELQLRLKGYFSRRLSSEHAADIEDLVQETLIAMHTRRMTYDPNQPFTAWAHAIARYKLIDFWRRRGRRIQVPLEHASGDLWVEAHEAGEAAADVDRLLAALPERQQKLIREVKIEGLSLAEAGARLGMTEGAAKVSLHRALKVLKSKVGGRADG